MTLSFGGVCVTSSLMFNFLSQWFLSWLDGLFASWFWSLILVFDFSLSFCFIFLIFSICS